MNDQKMKTLVSTVAIQNLCASLSMAENNVIILNYILNQKQVLLNLLALFGSPGDTPVEKLEAIAIQRKQKLLRLLWFKIGGSVEFWQNVGVSVV